MIIPIQPKGKPRITHRGRFKPSVQRYFSWCELLRNYVGGIVDGCTGAIKIVAYVEMPGSWRKKKKQEMAGQPHKQTPDADNIAKAVNDALFENDSFLYDVHVIKFWDDGGGPRIELLIA